MAGMTDEQLIAAKNHLSDTQLLFNILIKQYFSLFDFLNSQSSRESLSPISDAKEIFNKKIFFLSNFLNV